MGYYAYCITVFLMYSGSHTVHQLGIRWNEMLKTQVA